MLDPDIQAIVDAMEAAPGPPAHLVPVAQARAAHEAESVALGGPGEPVAEVRDVTAPGPGGPIPIRVFRPAGDGPLALVAYLHGGGWMLGSLTAFEPLCRALANASGAVIACVDYRLAPEHPFPAAADDARAAVRWLAAGAAELGADPHRLGIAGDSAGANLARSRPGACATPRRRRRCASRRSSIRSATARSTRRPTARTRSDSASRPRA